VGGEQGSILSTLHSPLSTNSSFRFHPSGYTLVEILVAAALTLLLMGAVIQMFGSLGQSITDSRSALEASERLNSAAARLQMDLKGVTVKMLPPRNPDAGEGYFEYIEGPAPPQQYIQQGTTANPPYNWDNNPLGVAPKPVNTDNGQTDTTVGDFDDILMFTTRSTGRPFVGLVDRVVFNTPVAQSDVAEVAWFIRGRTLYRRQLLVAPGLWNNLTTPPSASRFYEKNDISVRVQSGLIVPNTLSDLTRRECRYAHPTDVFPFDVRRWGLLGLPTLRESATWNLLSPPIPPSNSSNPSPLNPYYPNPYFDPGHFNLTATNPLDFWTNDPSHRLADPYKDLVLVPLTTRIADDIILTNVIGFDVKAWEPALGQYVDLGYEMRPIAPANPSKPQEIKHYPPETSNDNPYTSGEMFYHRGYCPLNAPQNGYLAYILGYYQSNSGIIYYTPRVYDTWSTHYENVGLGTLSQLYPNFYPPGRSTNGFDDPGNSGVANGIVDDDDEKITSPPYPAPLRGIQVKIRVFEPDSRQIREVTIVQDFLPK
jgi:type II secretory pathway pseudopilin PulG